MSLGGTLGLGITLTAADLASSTIKSVAKSLAGLDHGVAKFSKDIAKNLGVAEKAATQALSGMAKGFAVAAAGLAVLGGAIKLADDAGDFQYQMAEIGATTKLTAAEMVQAQKAILDMAAAGRSAPKETAEAFRELASSALSGDAALKALAPTMDLVRASFGKLSAGQAGGLMAKTLEAFPELGGDATRAADTLSRAIKNGGLKFEDLSAAMKGAARGAGILGGSLADTLAALAAIKAAGGDVTQGMRGINLAMKAIAAQKGKGGFHDLGVSVEDASGKLRPFLDVMGDLARRLQGVDEGTKQAALIKAFGTAAGPVSEILAQIGVEATKSGGDVAKAVDLMRAKFSDASVTARGMAQAQADTWNGIKEEIGNAFAAIREDVGGALLEVLIPVLSVVRDVVVGVAKAFRALPDWIKKAVAGFTAFAGVAAVVGGVVAALVTLAVTIGPEVLVAAVAAAAAAILTLGQVVLPAAAAIFFLYKVWTTNFGGIRDVVLPIVDKIRLAVMSLYHLFANGEISGALADDLTKAENSGIYKFVEFVSEAVATIAAFFRGLWHGLEPGIARASQIFGHAFKAIGTSFMAVFSAIGHVFNAFAKLFGMGTREQVGAVEDAGMIIGRVLGVVADAIAYVADFVASGIAGIATFIDVAAEIFEAIAGAVATAFTVASVVISAVMDGVEDAFRSSVNLIIEMLNFVIDTYASIPIVGELYKDAHIDEFTAPRRASPNGATQGAGNAGAPGMGSPSSTTASVSPIVATTQIPSSGPPAAAGPSAAELQSAFEAAASSRADPFKDRPIVVKSEVSLDGRKLAAWNAQESRDRSSGGGKIAPWK